MNARDIKINQQTADLAQRELDLQGRAETVDAARRDIEVREVDVRNKESTYRSRKKELDEQTKDVERREKELVEWMKELEWRECDFEEREEANERIAAHFKQNTFKRHKFNEALLSVQLSRMKDNYITSKERMLRQRAKGLPDLKKKRDFMHEVTDMTALKALNLDVKEKSTQFRRILAKLRGFEAEEDDDIMDAEPDDRIALKEAFTPKEAKDLKLISARERELREEASFMHQIHQCPMNHRHRFVNDTECIVALEQWWLDARDKVLDRHTRILKERLLHLKNAMAIFSPKKDEFPALFVERAVSASVSAKKRGGNLFTLSFPVGETFLKPLDPLQRPHTSSLTIQTNNSLAAAPSPYKRTPHGVTLPRGKANVRSRTVHSHHRSPPRVKNSQKRVETAPAGDGKRSSVAAAESEAASVAADERSNVEDDRKSHHSTRSTEKKSARSSASTSSKKRPGSKSKKSKKRSTSDDEHSNTSDYSRESAADSSHYSSDNYSDSDDPSTKRSSRSGTASSRRTSRTYTATTASSSEEDSGKSDSDYSASSTESD
eukprot:TRINITY_DN61280_c0_g1_i1.p1 TRINITY_DN61280_c0_g1~~TRINITY_DN61280_c0_g1_i1.p1  ORF type:complete len:565 (+),score=49.13 TRINITY_DN61280_c0_g1_i1:48-1697(+)